MQSEKFLKLMSDLDAEIVRRQEARDKNKCLCSMRTKLVGDGCSVCNPEYYQEMLSEGDDETR